LHRDIAPPRQGSQFVEQDAEGQAEKKKRGVLLSWERRKIGERARQQGGGKYYIQNSGHRTTEAERTVNRDEYLTSRLSCKIAEGKRENPKGRKEGSVFLGRN